MAATHGTTPWNDFGRLSKIIVLCVFECDVRKTCCLISTVIFSKKEDFFNTSARCTVLFVHYRYTDSPTFGSDANLRINTPKFSVIITKIYQ